MPKIILTRGLPASGKSTWAKKWVKEDPVNRKRVCRDDLRLMMHNVQYMPDNKKDLKRLEEDITYTRDWMIDIWSNDCNDIVVDECSLNPKYDIEKSIENILLLNGKLKKYRIVWKDFTDVPVQVCIKRDALRENPTGAKVIKAAYFKYLTDYNIEDSVKRQKKMLDSKKKAVIVDIDGTMSHIGNRSPYDGEKCSGDISDPTVQHLVHLLNEDGFQIIFLSGREGSKIAESETRKWIDQHAPMSIKGNYILYMRKEGDHRKDYIIKKELYEENIVAEWDVMFALDDRDQVVDLWRSMGIKCLQVEDGNF